MDHNGMLWKRSNETIILHIGYRGHSSAGRAAALQAVGQGFESPCLHQHAVGPKRRDCIGPVAQLVRACA